MKGKQRKIKAICMKGKCLDQAMTSQKHYSKLNKIWVIKL